MAPQARFSGKQIFLFIAVIVAVVAISRAPESSPEPHPYDVNLPMDWEKIIPMENCSFLNDPSLVLNGPKPDVWPWSDWDATQRAVNHRRGELNC